MPNSRLLWTLILYSEITTKLVYILIKSFGCFDLIVDIKRQPSWFVFWGKVGKFLVTDSWPVCHLNLKRKGNWGSDNFPPMFWLLNKYHIGSIDASIWAETLKRNWKEDKSRWADDWKCVGYYLGNFIVLDKVQKSHVRRWKWCLITLPKDYGCAAENDDWLPHESCSS